MLLKEQIYSNERRLYYHGRIKNFDSSKRLFYDFYITPRLEYAFPYAERGGIIEVYVFNKQVDILNIKSKFDEGVFRKLLQLRYQKYLGLIEEFKKRDWAELIGIEQRDSLLEDIKKIGIYDGYFDYEMDEETLENFHKKGLYKYFEKQLKSPAIGIFRMSCIDKVGEYPIEEMVDLDYEIEYIKDKAYKYKIKNFTKKDFLKDMLKSTFAISEDEILDIFESISESMVEDKKAKIKECCKDMLNRWRT